MLYTTSNVELRCWNCGAGNNLTVRENDVRTSSRKPLPVLQPEIAELYSPAFYQRVLQSNRVRD
jgi:hypothetical protein